MASVRYLLESRANENFSRRNLKTSSCISRVSLKNLDNPNLKDLQRVVRAKENNTPKTKVAPINYKPKSEPVSNVSLVKEDSISQEKCIEEEVTLENASEEEFTPIEDCPLSRDDIPIVGEAEHCVGYCYCHHCTCGQHPCPGIELRREVSAKSAWTTSYRQDFKSKPSEAPNTPASIPVDSQERYRPRYKDLTTTNRSDFKVPIASPLKHERSENQIFHLKHTTRSSYSRDFPDWKYGELVTIKPGQLPYRGGMLRANISTTYAENFKDFKDKDSPIKDSSKKRTFSTSCLTERNTGPISLLNHFTSETTSRTNFKNLISASKILNRKANSKIAASLLNSTPRTHFITMYQTEFKNKLHPASLTRHRA